MRNSILQDNNILYLSYSFLQHNEIKSKTIEKWVERKIVKPVKFNGVSFIKLSDIPNTSKKKLPAESVLIEMSKAQEKGNEVYKLSNGLEKAYFVRTPHYQNHYSSKYKLPPSKILEISRLHAVWEKLIETQGGYGWINNALKSFDKLFPGKYKTYNSFANALSKAKRLGVESVAFDVRFIKEKVQVYDEQIYTMLRALVAMPIKYTDKQIFERIMEFAKDLGITNIPTSFEWVKKHRKQLLKSNHEIYTIRYGTQMAKKREPFVKIIGAKNPMSQVQIDGFTVPVYYKNENTSWAKLIVFSVLDNHSKKIIGFSIGESEDTGLILSGINDAISNTGYLPNEIISDNHSSNKTDELKYFKDGLSNYGVNWTISENPQFKSKLERTFKHLNENYFKNIPGWTGQGVLTRDINGKPSQEYIDHYQKSENRRTKEEITINIIHCIEQYNNTPLGNCGKSPTQIFEETDKPHAVKVDILQIAKLFNKAKKAQVRRGQIDITRGGIKYEFQLNAELMHKYNNHEVLVRYEDLAECIYIFDIEKDMPIAEVKPKVGIHGALADQTEEDKQKYLKQKGRLKGYKQKSKKENGKFAHPDAIHHLNKITTPKDIVKEFQENPDLARLAARHGIDVNKVLTGANNETFVMKSLMPVEPKKEATPILPVKHIIKTINPNGH